MQKKTLIITPTYNERDNVVELINKLQDLNQNLDILVIDDNSPDGTATAVKELQNKFSNLKLLERKGKLGLGTAYIFGFKKGIEWDYDNIITMDADLSHQPKYIPEIISKLNNYNLVIGSRYTKNGGIKNWSLKRRLLSRFGNLYAKIILGVPFNDITAGFMGIQVSELQKINLDKIDGVGYAFLQEMKYNFYKNKNSIKEVPIIFYERTRGKSKISSNIIKEGIFMPWKLKFKNVK